MDEAIQSLEGLILGLTIVAAFMLAGPCVLGIVATLMAVVRILWEKIWEIC